MTNSWVYIFSQFTSEALLFEALIIFLLCCGYTAFWILRKRRYGVVDTALPSGPVKSYLNELITNSEQLRLQLFGLLSASNLSNSQPQVVLSTAPLSPSTNVGDTELAKKLVSLESKMSEQAKALETIAGEKARVERELSEARASAASGAPSSDTGALVGMQQKIRDLEGRLAEYNVIEDDLANLKRLQQENTQLKAALAGKNIAEPSPAPKAPEPTAPTGPAPTPPADAFAGLAKPVEESLQAATPGAPASEPSPAGAPPAAANNTEADLVAEFEKMLKG